MEEHRLIQMPENYDEELFNQLYTDTKYLRIKLARSIDPRVFGVEYEDILSWFDVKFIFIFTKYYDTVDNNILKGKIINGLQFFKNRILRHGYTQKNSINQTFDISEFFNIESKEFIYVEEEKDPGLAEVIPFFRKHLDSLAFHVFTIDYNPPLYILVRLETDKINHKMPEDLICRFLGIDYNEKTYQEILKARGRYKKLISQLKK